MAQQKLKEEEADKQEGFAKEGALHQSLPLFLPADLGCLPRIHALGPFSGACLLFDGSKGPDNSSTDETPRIRFAEPRTAALNCCCLPLCRCSARISQSPSLLSPGDLRLLFRYLRMKVLVAGMATSQSAEAKKLQKKNSRSSINEKLVDEEWLGLHARVCEDCALLYMGSASADMRGARQQPLPPVARLRPTTVSVGVPRCAYQRQASTLQRTLGMPRKYRMAPPPCSGRRKAVAQSRKSSRKAVAVALVAAEELAIPMLRSLRRSLDFTPSEGAELIVRLAEKPEPCHQTLCNQLTVLCVGQAERREDSVVRQGCEGGHGGRGSRRRAAQGEGSRSQAGTHPAPNSRGV